MSELNEDTDRLQRFYFQRFNARGQLVNLDHTLAELLVRRDYPDPVLELLGQMMCAVAMIADGLKWPGSVALQSKGGHLRTSLAEHRHGGLMRAIARPASEDGFELPEDTSIDSLIGDGQLALSLIPAEDDRRSQPYQGLVAWEQDRLADNLRNYFATSEQLDTRFLLYADRQHARGLLLQRLPGGERDDFVHETLQQEFWERVSTRVDGTVPAELLGNSPPALLSRLFRDDSLVLAPAQPLLFACTCNRDKTSGVLRMLGREDMLELLEERGCIEVTCEFCGQLYRYDALETHLELSGNDLTKH